MRAVTAPSPPAIVGAAQPRWPLLRCPECPHIANGQKSLAEHLIAAHAEDPEEAVLRVRDLAMGGDAASSKENPMPSTKVCPCGGIKRHKSTCEHYTKKATGGGKVGKPKARKTGLPKKRKAGSRNSPRAAELPPDFGKGSGDALNAHAHARALLRERMREELAIARAYVVELEAVVGA